MYSKLESAIKKLPDKLTNWQVFFFNFMFLQHISFEALRLKLMDLKF